MPQWPDGGSGVRIDGRLRSRMLQGHRQALVWLIPAAVAAAMFVLSGKEIGELIGASVALLLFVFLVNRPGVTLISLIIFLPFETFLFALLLHWGVPTFILRPASSLKELMALAIVVAGLREIRDTGRRMDRIDIAVLLYVGVVTIYLLVPHLFSSIAPTQLEVRLLGWRSDAGYPLLFFGARHAPIRSEVRERFINVIIAMGAVVALVALYQRLAPMPFSHFVLNTAQVPTYFFKVLGLPPTVISQNLEYITTLSPLHVSSVFLSPFDMSDYLVLVIAMVAVRISRGSRSPSLFLVLAAVLGSIFFSDTRADALAAVIILVLIALPSPRSPIEGRLRLIGTLVLAAVVIIPSLGGTRFVGAQGAAASTNNHLNDFGYSLDVIDAYPLGLGLGSVPSSVNRFEVQGFGLNGEDFSQDLVIQVAYELGLPALLPWLAMMVLVLLALRRRGDQGVMLASGAGLGLLGIVIGGLFHHVFVELPVPWTLWSGVGLALSVHQDYDQNGTVRATNSYPETYGVP
jgi:hypothetical protein